MKLKISAPFDVCTIRLWDIKSEMNNDKLHFIVGAVATERSKRMCSVIIFC